MAYSDVSYDSEEDQIYFEEEEDFQAFGPLFDRETFIRKLKEKPQFPKEAKDCGTNNPQKSYQYWQAPLADRLSLPTLSAIDYLKQRVPFPIGCIPPLSLPSWHFLPLERRIPYLTAGKDLIYYTRGKLGQDLFRRTIYSVRDEHNYERVVGGPYNALHDSHVKQYHLTPNHFQWLHQIGFINEKAEVLCTLKEFNKFRDYLRTIWCDVVTKEVEAEDLYIASQRDQCQALMKAESANAAEGRAAIVANRISSAKKLHKELMDLKKTKQQTRDEINEARLKQWRAEKEQDLIEHIMGGMDKARRNRERLQALHQERLQRQRDIMTKSVAKLIETEERRKNDKAMIQAAYDKYLLEWLEAKYVHCYENMIHRKQLQEDVRENRKYKARRRQLRLEAYREAMPGIQAKRKEERERILAIVRKFAMRWLLKARANLNRPKDETHESCWIGQTKGVLDDTIKYLYQQSGHEHLDNFILSIIKLKKEIREQLELDEAEEAAEEEKANHRAKLAIEMAAGNKHLS